MSLGLPRLVPWSFEFLRNFRQSLHRLECRPSALLSSFQRSSKWKLEKNSNGHYQLSIRWIRVTDFFVISSSSSIINPAYDFIYRAEICCICLCVCV